MTFSASVGRRRRRAASCRVRGATIASFVAYGVEGQYGRATARARHGHSRRASSRRRWRRRRRSAAHMVPLLTLGIPGSGATAVILGAFLLHGRAARAADLPDAVGARLRDLRVAVRRRCIGMCVLGYFADPARWSRCSYLPEAIVSVFVVHVLLDRRLFRAQQRHRPVDDRRRSASSATCSSGYRFPIAPMVLGMILGPVAETAFLTTMISYSNDWTVFFTRPVSGVLMVMAAHRAPVSARTGTSCGAADARRAPWRRRDRDRDRARRTCTGSKSRSRRRTSCRSDR